MTNKQIQEAVSMLRQQLKTTKTTSSTVELRYTLAMSNMPKATLVIENTAWQKICALVDQCDKEVAWHGIVRKENNVYTITDVLVFPQEVTGATVTSDETEYSLWLMQQPDEVFNNIRFHGHSHVNMGVSPSGVDTHYQDNILKNLKDFYIFAIFNKKGDNWVSIYDVEDNIAYGDKDIELVLPNDEAESWAAQEIKAKVRIKTVTRPVATVRNTPATRQKDDDDDIVAYASQFVDRGYDKSGKKKAQNGLADDGYDYYGNYGYGGYGGYYGQK